MSPLLDLPPEVILHIMRFARWSGTNPDYASMTVSSQLPKHSTSMRFSDRGIESTSPGL
jgi:hypothetical protein